MKVLLINGSARNQGNTMTALEEAAKQLEKEGIETEILQIGNKPIRGCIACGGCRKKGNNRCIFNDDVCNQIIEKAEGADGFIFGTPVYYGAANGALLALIQRALFAGGDAFKYKPYANLAVCRRGGTMTAYTMMNIPFQMMCMPQVNGRYWGAVFGMAPGEAAKDTEGMQNARVVAQNMAWILKNPQPHPEYPAQVEAMNFIR